jgi:hypothetical protein
MLQGYAWLEGVRVVVEDFELSYGQRARYSLAQTGLGHGRGWSLPISASNPGWRTRLIDGVTG